MCSKKLLNIILMNHLNINYLKILFHPKPPLIKLLINYILKFIYTKTYINNNKYHSGLNLLYVKLVTYFYDVDSSPSFSFTSNLLPKFYIEKIYRSLPTTHLMLKLPSTHSRDLHNSQIRNPWIFHLFAL